MSVIVGERLTFAQKHALAIELLVFGDEHYARYETLDGFTVVFDAPVGMFCYAALSHGNLVSTGVSALVGAPSGIRRHLRESSDVRRDKAGRRRNRPRAGGGTMLSSAPAFAYGPSSGLLPGRRLSIGSVKGLTILVQFKDVKTRVTKGEVDALLNDPSYSKNGNACSARTYFQTVSGGKLDYQNVVVGPYTLSQDLAYYVDHLLIKEALDLAVADGLDLSQFDSKKQGIIDALSVLYAGQTQYLGELWPHNFNIDLRYGAIRTDLYLLTSAGRTAADLSIGTFCHENGHLLCRFPDLYDYGNRDGDDVASEGVGVYCLMGSGNHNDSGRTPAPVCGYLRDLAGWCDTVVALDRPGPVEVKHGDYKTIHKHKTTRENEYFIVENRSKIGLDGGLPSSGLAVLHCDILGSNEWQEGTAGRHYQCALIQADGRQHLENGLNRGDGTDLFAGVAGTALAHDTNPSSRQWDGSDSGLRISAIGAPRETMSFVVGDQTEATYARGDATPRLKVPDNDQKGVESKIALAGTGKAKKLRVQVDLTHPWIGDLVLTLAAPSGRRAVLHNGSGGNQHDLLATYSSEDHTGLASLVGEAVAGDWTLVVQDRAAEDVGLLNKWHLEIALDQAPVTESHTAKPNVDIPDNKQAGIVSVLSFSTPGVLSRLKASVEIRHQHVGDLRVRLVSPSGRAATLHGRIGGAKRDLVETYDSAKAASPLSSLVGQSLSGNWTLLVADLASRNEGVLASWSLELTAGQ